MTVARVRPALRMRELLTAAVGSASRVDDQLEAAFAKKFGFAHAVFFPHARSALFALCKVMGWHAREAACPSYTCAVVPGAIAAARAAVRFVDSAPDHFMPDRAAWERALNDTTALAVVSPLFGYPVQDDVLDAVRKKAPRAFLLVDEAQSYSSDNLLRAGSRVDGALFSLGIGKLVTALAGGMLLLRDAGLASALRSVMRSPSIGADLARTAKLAGIGAGAIVAFREPAISVLDRLLGPNAPENPDLPSNALVRLPPIAAHVGLRQLGRLDEVLSERRRIGSYYERRLREERFRTFSYERTPTWVRYPLPVHDRATVLSVLRRSGIQAGLFLDYQCTQLAPWREIAAVPNAERWARSMINLPNWFGISEKSAERVVRTLMSAGEAASWPSQTEANAV